MKPMVLRDVGVVHSPWILAEGTPIQSFVARYEAGGWIRGEEDSRPAPHVNHRGGRGTLEIVPEWKDALRDLDGFSHLWVLFWCDRAKNPCPLVTPYRDIREHGLFATRAPSRPNPIGMSCLQIVSVVDRFVHVTGMDILHGTPIVDIKPYIPDYDSFRTASRGWLEDATTDERIVRADDRFYAG